MADVSPKSNKTPRSEYQTVNDLMKELGSPDGFDPLPPGQHRWHMDREGTTPIQRMWAWMVKHTVHWGHRTAYAAIRDGNKIRELHMEHCAKDLNMDLGNAYRVWKQGKDRGLWRNGTEKEERRMYLCGRVPRQSAEQPASKSAGEWPPYITRAIQDWPQKRVELLRHQLDREATLERIAQAEVITANRCVFRDRIDAILQEFGIVPRRQEHGKNGETAEAAAARQARLAALRPTVEKFVQTVADVVQCQNPDIVQHSVSLLCSESKNQSVISRSVGPSARSRGVKASAVDRRKKIDQLPAPQTITPLSDQEKRAEDLLFSEIGHMQKHEAFQHMEFTHEQINPQRGSDQLFCHRVVAAVGPDCMEQFLRRVWVQLEHLDRNALGKLPGRAPAPRSLGLILQWAVEYGKKIDEAARQTADQQAAWKAREVEALRQIAADQTEPAEVREQARTRLQDFAVESERSA